MSEVPDRPPAVPYDQANLPPLQPQDNMPDAATAPADPATDMPRAVDVDAIGVPDAPADAVADSGSTADAGTDAASRAGDDRPVRPADWSTPPTSRTRVTRSPFETHSDQSATGPWSDPRSGFQPFCSAFASAGSTVGP